MFSLHPGVYYLGVFTIRGLGNPSIDQDLKLHVHNLGILNTCNYFSNPRIFNIKTTIHSRCKSVISTSQRLISEGSYNNNSVVIHNKQRVILVMITVRDQTFKRRETPSARVIEPVPIPPL